MAAVPEDTREGILAGMAAVPVAIPEDTPEAIPEDIREVIPVGMGLLEEGVLVVEVEHLPAAVQQTLVVVLVAPVHQEVILVEPGKCNL